MTERESQDAMSTRSIHAALEGIEAWRATPDGYCACDESGKCYLHGVTIPAALNDLRILTSLIEGGRRVGE